MRGAFTGGAFTAEMKDDLANTVLNMRPNDFGFIGNVWTCPLLVEYIYSNRVIYPAGIKIGVDKFSK